MRGNGYGEGHGSAQVLRGDALAVSISVIHSSSRTDDASAKAPPANLRLRMRPMVFPEKTKTVWVCSPCKTVRSGCSDRSGPIARNENEQLFHRRVVHFGDVFPVDQMIDEGL